MCDTLVALPQRTASGNLILGKNSDREPLEAQAILQIPHRFPSEKEVRCTYISIPQAKETYEVIFSKPFQMWGAEMGVNEFGLVIGNEAVFTNVKFNKKEIGLTGMDLLRLALERCKTAREALKTIATLLRKYGQNACGGYENRSFYYHNSFLIADTKEAFIFETAGKSWAYRQVESLGSISNGLTISEDYDEVHWEKESRTLQKLFAGKSGNFRNHFSDLLYTTAGKSKERQTCTLGFLMKKENLSVSDFFSAMRQHNLPQKEFNPKKATTGSICMHATGFTNPSDTTGSMVAEIRKGRPSTSWLSASSYPCLSLYLPFYFGNSIDPVAFSPGAYPDESIWWQAKKVHQIILGDYQKLQPEYRIRLDKIQEKWLKKDLELIEKNASKEELADFSNSCRESYLELLQDFALQKK
jgi:dipeptidase